jgi:hypothetical protein
LGRSMIRRRWPPSCAQVMIAVVVFIKEAWWFALVHLHAWPRLLGGLLPTQLPCSRTRSLLRRVHQGFDMFEM